MAWYDCPYCGKERAHSYYGGVGSCNCSGHLAHEARLQELVDAQHQADAEAKEQQGRCEAACSGHYYVQSGMHIARCIYCGKIVGG